jgi:hypothetical protein
MQDKCYFRILTYLIIMLETFHETSNAYKDEEKRDIQVYIQIFLAMTP